MTELGQVVTAGMAELEAGNLDPLALVALADNTSAAGDVTGAADVYRRWLAQNPDHPVRHAIAFNYAMLKSRNGHLAEAADVMREVTSTHPEFLAAHINLGLILERIGCLTDAVQSWQHVASELANVNRDTLSHKQAALKQLGRVFESAHRDPAAESVLRQSLEVAPRQNDILQHWLNLRQRQCKWPVVEPLPDIAADEMVRRMSPLTLAAYTDDPALQLANAAEYFEAEGTRPDAIEAACRRTANPIRSRPVRIGYLSSDLRAHAVGYLVCEVFELHDRKSFTVHAYYSGPPATDELHTRIKEAVDAWHDISGMADEAAARMIAADEIDILIDLNGYTHGSRIGLLKLRPAPVVVNWLGFPGTCGSPDHDYIIADDFIIPRTSETFYSETVLRLPCYQPNDRRRPRVPPQTSRQHAMLPEHGTVYCCFNGAHKITSPTWERWMTILQRVEDSVLWLMQGVSTTNERLVEAASGHGIEADRIIFAPHLPHAQHLARIQLADLFLDTWPYGAHTTASDALWAGVPVITLAGRSFASRVCGSLVSAACLGELVCTTPEQYIAVAVELGRDETKRLDVRRRLDGSRDVCSMFDSPRLVAALESALRRVLSGNAHGRPRSPLMLQRNAIVHRAGCDLASMPDGHALDYGASLARCELAA